MIVGLMIFYSLIGTVSVVGNLTVIFVVYKSKQLRHNQYVYNCSIALSDIIWGLTISYFFVNFFVELLALNTIYLEEEYPLKYSFYDSITKPEVNKDENNITTFSYELDYVKLSRRLFYDNYYTMMILIYITPVTLLVSFLSLLCASIDRYIALTFPFKYKQINSIKIAKVISVFVWIFSATVNTATLFVYNWKYGTNWPLLFQPISEYNIGSLNQRITAAILFILFSLLWTVTFLTLYSLYKSYKMSSSLNKNTRKNVSLEKQMSLILIVMVVAFTFSLFPTIYFNASFYLYNEYFYVTKVEKKFIISVGFLVTNSIWNYVIYNILNKKFRCALINFCFKC